MPTPSDVINIAKVSEYLWNDTIAKEGGLFGGTIDPRKARQLYMEWKALQYGYEQNINGTQAVQGVANYVYALCGAKVATAMDIIDGGSSGGSVIIGGGGIREYFAYASAGYNEIVFPLAINASILFASRGGIVAGKFVPTTPVNNEVKWDTVTGTLTFAATVPFVENEEIHIIVK